MRGHGLPPDEGDILRMESDALAQLVHYVRDPHPLAPGDRVDGWEVLVLPGHADGHVCLLRDGVLIAGDMCSDVEIPLLDTGAADPLGDYRTGMDRLASAPGVRRVVPGHGHIGDAAELRRRLALDAAYLDAVSAGRPYRDPRLTADSPDWMQAVHEDLVRYFEG